MSNVTKKKLTVGLATMGDFVNRDRFAFVVNSKQNAIIPYSITVSTYAGQFFCSPAPRILRQSLENFKNFCDRFFGDRFKVFRNSIVIKKPVQRLGAEVFQLTQKSGMRNGSATGCHGMFQIQSILEIMQMLHNFFIFGHRQKYRFCPAAIVHNKLIGFRSHSQSIPVVSRQGQGEL